MSQSNDQTGMERWKDRVALVTGASSGIGRAVARSLAERGMRVAVCARRQDALEALRKQAEEAGGQVLPVAADLRDEQQILDVFQTVRNQWGGVDVLVNNAGLGHHAPLMDAETEPWREMLEVNVLALLICTREALRDMRERGDNGQVIHISSLAAHRVPTASGVYSATKFAVRALTEGLRQELRIADSHIRVTSISPGYVETEFAEHYFGSEEAARKAYGRFKVLADSDVSEAVLYVLGTPPHVGIHDILMRPVEQPT